MTTADAENEVPTDTGINLTSAAARRLALIALIEIPQACSLKFLTCEQRSV